MRVILDIADKTSFEQLAELTKLIKSFDDSNYIKSYKI